MCREEPHSLLVGQGGWSCLLQWVLRPTPLLPITRVLISLDFCLALENKREKKSQTREKDTGGKKGSKKNRVKERPMKQRGKQLWGWRMV